LDGRSPTPVAAAGRLLQPVVGSCPGVCGAVLVLSLAGCCLYEARDGLGCQWEEP
jgi:hypothetical protein